MLCSTCGNYHDGMSSCPGTVTIIPTTIHFPARSVQSHEPLEHCPMCNGNGYIASSLRQKMADVLKLIGGIFQ